MNTSSQSYQPTKENGSYQPGDEISFRSILTSALPNGNDIATAIDRIFQPDAKEVAGAIDRTVADNGSTIKFKLVGVYTSREAADTPGARVYPLKIEELSYRKAG